VREPDARSSGRQSNEECFFLVAVGPSRWLQAVVAYEERRGWIVTAFGRRRRPVTVTIGNIVFDRVRYDAEGDVLYLHRANPATPRPSTPAQRAITFASMPRAS